MSRERSLSPDDDSISLSSGSDLERGSHINHETVRYPPPPPPFIPSQHKRPLLKYDPRARIIHREYQEPEHPRRASFSPEIEQHRVVRKPAVNEIEYVRKSDFPVRHVQIKQKKREKKEDIFRKREPEAFPVKVKPEPEFKRKRRKHSRPRSSDGASESEEDENLRKLREKRKRKHKHRNYEKHRRKRRKEKHRHKKKAKSRSESEERRSNQSDAHEKEVRLSHSEEESKKSPKESSQVKQEKSSESDSSHSSPEVKRNLKNGRHSSSERSDKDVIKDEPVNKDRKEEKKDRWGYNEEVMEQKPDTQEKQEGEKDNVKMGLSGKLTEDANMYNGVVIKYSQPPEARKPKRRWRWYIFKGDQELPFLPLHRQSAYLIGRDRKVADIPTDHPSCSKQHSVLQYRLVNYEKPDGSQGRTVKPYIIDLESANGTYVNNKRIDAKRYVELMEKDVVKFGYSSREYVLLHEASKGDEDTMAPIENDLSPISLLKSL